MARPVQPEGVALSSSPGVPQEDSQRAPDSGLPLTRENSGLTRFGVWLAAAPHESQHARPPCPSPTPRAYSNSCLTVSDFILGGSKITADGDFSHEIKRRLLLGRKVMTNLDSIFKSRDITLPTNVCLVKAMVFPVVMYGCESWTVEAEC